MLRTAGPAPILHRAQPQKGQLAPVTEKKLPVRLRPRCGHCSLLPSQLVRILGVSIIAQNKRYDQLGEASIAALDIQWTQERESFDKPLIAATLSNIGSVHLSRMQGKSLGLYPEIS